MLVSRTGTGSFAGATSLRLRTHKIKHTEASTSMPGIIRPAVRRRQHQSRRTFLRYAHRGTEPQAYVGNSDPRLTTLVSQKHGCQATPDSIAQLRQLYRGACVVCGAVRSRRGDRLHGHQEHPSDGVANHRPPAALRPAPPRDPLDDSPAPGNPVGDIAITLSDAVCWESFTEPQHCPFLSVSCRGTPQTRQRALKERSVICRYRCRILLVEIPQRV